VTFIRKKRVNQTDYFQLVENGRVNGRVQQRVLMSLGQCRTIAETKEFLKERILYFEGIKDSLEKRGVRPKTKLMFQANEPPIFRFYSLEQTENKITEAEQQLSFLTEYERSAKCDRRTSIRRSAVTAMVQTHVPQLIAMQISGHKTASMFHRYGIVVEAELSDAMAATEAYHAAQQQKQAQQQLPNVVSIAK